MPDPTHSATCDCGAVELLLRGEPRVRGFCHCEDCRAFLKVPYHSVTAWEGDAAEIVRGEDELAYFQHPEKRMQRAWCRQCGETVFNTNAMGWRIVSQLLIRRSHGGSLPRALASKSHFFYGRRIVDIDDDLPKRE